jgi:hypothetical protein
MTKKFQVLIALLSVAGTGVAQTSRFRPGFNLFSKDQDIQLGREAAAKVEEKAQVIRDPRVQDYINRIGQKLAAQPQAGGFPFTFKVVNDPSINAFALPGGPTFINTGLIVAADNEAQLAGVMAHEMSHVALRHGTNQVSKANLVQIPAALLGSVVGGGSGSLLGGLANLGATGLLLKFSRTDESQADLNGAQIMAGAGYNPLEMARFFEKLEAQGGHAGPQFLSDHPNPGNRKLAIENEVRSFPQRNYIADSQDFHQIQAIVKQIPPAKGGAAQHALTEQSGGASPNAPSGDLRPSGRLREYRSGSFSLSYPDNWQIFGDSGSNTITIAPKSAIAQDENGHAQIGIGLMASYYLPHGDRINLQQDTADLVRQLQRQNPNMEVGNGGTRRVAVGGTDGLATTLYAQSPYRGETEHDTLITVARPEGLFYMIFIVPAKVAADFQNTFENMVRSVRFSN